MEEQDLAIGLQFQAPNGQIGTVVAFTDPQNVIIAWDKRIIHEPEFREYPIWWAVREGFNGIRRLTGERIWLILPERATVSDDTTQRAAHNHLDFGGARHIS